MSLVKVPSGTTTPSKKSDSNPLTKRTVTCVGEVAVAFQTTLAVLVLMSTSSQSQSIAPSAKALDAASVAAARIDVQVLVFMGCSLFSMFEISSPAFGGAAFVSTAGVAAASATAATIAGCSTAVGAFAATGGSSAAVSAATGSSAVSSGADGEKTPAMANAAA